MKEIMMDSVPTGESAEKENFANRKLIRPTLQRVENHGNNHTPAPMQLQERRERPERARHQPVLVERDSRGEGRQPEQPPAAEVHGAEHHGGQGGRDHDP